MLRHPKIPNVYFAVALADCVPNANHNTPNVCLFRETDFRYNENRVEGLPHQAEWATVRVEYRYMERIMRSVKSTAWVCAFWGGGMQKQTLEI